MRTNKMIDQEDRKTNKMIMMSEDDIVFEETNNCESNTSATVSLVSNRSHSNPATPKNMVTSPTNNTQSTTNT